MGQMNAVKMFTPVKKRWHLFKASLGAKGFLEVYSLFVLKYGSLLLRSY